MKNLIGRAVILGAVFFGLVSHAEFQMLAPQVGGQVKGVDLEWPGSDLKIELRGARLTPVGNLVVRGKTFAATKILLRPDGDGSLILMYFTSPDQQAIAALLGADVDLTSARGERFVILLPFASEKSERLMVAAIVKQPIEYQQNTGGPTPPPPEPRTVAPPVARPRSVAPTPSAPADPAPSSRFEDL